MMKPATHFFLNFLLLTSSLFALDPTDEAAINQIIEHFADAWNNHEGRSSADYYSQDADFVNIFGMLFKGKEEIETRHIKIHETFLRGSTFKVINARLREAKPGVVIAHVDWQVTDIQRLEQNFIYEVMNGIFTHVFLKHDDKWEITATQNTLISPFKAKD